MTAKKKKVTMTKKKMAKVKSNPVQKETPKKVFYVGVTNPQEKQRSLLQVTADYLRLLQNIEHLKVTRKKKREVIGQFHKVMQEIRSDAAKIYKLLPKYDLPKKARPVVPKMVVEEKPVVDEPKKVVVKTEIDSLEAELAAIEGRLGTL